MAPIACAPTASALVVYAAVAVVPEAVSGTVASVVLAVGERDWPLGACVRRPAGPTVAVNVTLCPAVIEALEAATDTAGAARNRFGRRRARGLALKLASPA